MSFSSILANMQAFMIFSILSIVILPATARTQQLQPSQQVAANVADPTSKPAAPTLEQLQESVRLLQAQVRALGEKIEQLQAAGKNEDDSKPAAVITAADATEPKIRNSAAVSSPPAQQKQQGVELGGVHVTPYGTVYFNAFNNSSGVNNQDVPSFATPTGQGSLSASVRQTRLGLRFEGARVGSAKLSGVLEADFYGGIPAIGIGENFGVVRLRLANARFDWEKTSVTVGQDWMPFAPVNPVSLAAAAIPQMAAVGNNWARLPLIRVDRRLTKNLTLTGAVLAPQTGDHPTASGFFLQPTSGAASHTPFFQSRVAFAGNNWLGSKKSGSVGLSGHYGRSKVVSAPNDIDSFGVALDWNLPLHKRLTLAGEGFFGRNLGGFQAGVFQGVNAEFAFRNGTSVIPAGARGIATKGGWVQLGFTPPVFADRWSIFSSVGLDDPRDRDLTSISRFNFRTRNLAYAANTIFKLTPQFWLGAEVRRFETSYFNTGRSASNHFNLGASYSF